MPLQPPTYVGLLDPTDPKGTDSRTISDDYHRMIQESCRQTTPNYTNEVTATHEDTNLLSGYVANGVKPLPGEGGVTTIYHYGATAAVGYTILEPDNNLRELVIGPAASGGTIGGVDDPTDMSENVNINISGTTSDDGRHAHFYQFDTNFPNEGDVNVAAGSGASAARQNHTHNSGAQQVQEAGLHDHTFSDSDSDNVRLQPRYARGIFMQLDA